MGTQATTVETKKTKQERHSWTVRYTNGRDAMEVKLEHRRDGSWRTYCKHVQGTGKTRKTERGATELHLTEKDARAAWERLQASVQKAGWTKRESRGGFGARPDAFSLATLPRASAK